MVLLKIDDNHASLAWVHPDDGGLRQFDRNATVNLRDIGGRTGSLKIDNRGKLILRSGSDAAVIDTDAEFEVHDLRRVQLRNDQVRWSGAFLNLLVDSASRAMSGFAVDRKALELEDPGYTEPTDAILLPNGDEVAITIARSQHMAFLNFVTGETRLLNLAGSYGNSNAVVENDALWVVNYDTLCRIDLETLRLDFSPGLQAPFRDAQSGLITNAFVGVPTMSRSLDGWLIPRPFSGDILLVSTRTLHPERRLPCGGRPHSVVEFDGSDLLILNHPFDSFQTAKIDQFVPL